MKAILNIIRVLISSVILLIFIVFLTLTPTIFTLSKILTHRENVISLLDKMGGYQLVSNLAVEKVKENLYDQGLSKAMVRPFEPKIRKAFSPEFAKSIVTSAVNGIYDWLEGKTKDIQVNFQNVDFRKALIEGLPKEILKADGFTQIMGSLKPCTDAQITKYDQQGGFRSITEFCIPPKLKLLSIGNSSKSDTKKGVITTDNIFQIPPLSIDTASRILTGFNVLQHIGFIVFGVLTILLFLFLVVAPTRNFKIYFITTVIALNGLIGVIAWKTIYLQNLVSSLVTKQLEKDTSNILIGKDLILNAAMAVYKELSNYEVTYFIYIMGTGIALLLISLIANYIFNKRNS